MAPYFPFWMKLVLSNIWLFKPAVLAVASAEPETRALARTTTAFTIVSGGVKDNVLPEKARALVNHRLHPGDDAAGVIEWDQSVVKGTEGVVARVKAGWKNEPS